MASVISEELYNFSPLAFELLVEGKEFVPRKGRPPYSLGFARADNGLFIFSHPCLPHVLFELTGQGCDVLGVDERAIQFLSELSSRLTRIDVASDMLCDTSPLDFTAQRAGGRFKSHSEFVSESGTTAYIGSRTSNRYARVYRYNPPHERAHLLRAEHVLKSEDAKNTAQAIIEQGLEAVAVALGASFGWQHASWHPEAVESAEIAVWRPERHEGKTMFWLNDTVASVLVRLHEEGKLDVTEWLRDNVLSRLTPPAP